MQTNPTQFPAPCAMYMTGTRQWVVADAACRLWVVGSHYRAWDTKNPYRGPVSRLALQRVNSSSAMFLGIPFRVAD